MNNRRNKLEDALFLAPAVMVSALFLLIPLISCFYYSVTNFDGFTQNFRFVGMRNFRNLLTDLEYMQSLKTTFLITGVGVIYSNVFGILVAVWMDHKSRAFNFSKSLLFIPCILSSVVVSFIWSYMTQSNNGVINNILSMMRVPGVDFFASSLTITFMVAWVINWAAFGLYLTIYDASIKTIPPELFEAAIVDGAGPATRFWRITLPLLYPGITICTVLSMIGGLRQFDFVKIVTPKQIYTVTVYAVERAFDFNMYGYASAIVLVLFVLIVALSALQLMLMKRFEVDY